MPGNGGDRAGEVNWIQSMKGFDFLLLSSENIYDFIVGTCWRKTARQQSTRKFKRHKKVIKY